jgi:hypothetical protein
MERGVALVATQHDDEPDLGVVPAWCPFGRHFAHVAGDALYVCDGTTAACVLARPLHGARVIYLLWARCGRKLTWLAGVEGALALFALELGAPAHAPAPSLAHGVPLFYGVRRAWRARRKSVLGEQAPKGL